MPIPYSKGAATKRMAIRECGFEPSTVSFVASRLLCAPVVETWSPCQEESSFESSFDDREFSAAAGGDDIERERNFGQSAWSSIALCTHDNRKTWLHPRNDTWGSN